jgi:hypothetical protein
MAKFLNKRSPFSPKSVPRPWIVFRVRDALLSGKNIQGPVNFIYLKGDSGDDVERKVLLLGDLHIPEISCPSEEGNVSLIEFFRIVAKSMPSKIIDLFVESFYDTEDNIYESSENREEKEGHYLGNLRLVLSPCLKRDKSQCSEPMRVHYIDPRGIFPNAKENPSSLIVMERLFRRLLPPPNLHTKLYSLVRWPEDSEIKDIAIKTLKDARLSNDKIQSIDSKIRQKFIDVVISPLMQKIILFYEDMSNYNTFTRIMRTAYNVRFFGASFSEDENKTIKDFYYKIFDIRTTILDAYFVYRLFKRATSRKSDRPRLALTPGQAITHVIGYTGVAHVCRIRNILLEMGLSILDEGDYNNMKERTRFDNNVVQCLPYSLIKNSIDDFTS